MQVKSIAECSKGSILRYFRPSLSYHSSLRSLFSLFWSGRLRQRLLYCCVGFFACLFLKLPVWHVKGTLPSFSCGQATSAMSTRGIPTRIKALRVLMGTAAFVCLFLKLPVWHVKGTLPFFSCDQAISAMSTRGIPARIKALRVLMGTAVFVCLFLKLPVWHVKGTLPSFSCDQATSAMSTRGIPRRKTSSLPNPKTDRKLAMINS